MINHSVIIKSIIIIKLLEEDIMMPPVLEAEVVDLVIRYVAEVEVEVIIPG